MYLAYLDDSGSDSKSPVVLVGSVLIPDDFFQHIETLLGMVVEGLIPEEKRATFKEFHSAELYWGHGAFEGLPEEDRFQAIRSLLGIVRTFKLPFIYSAVDRKLLAQSPFGSVHPVDVAFRMCALGVQTWLEANGKERVVDSQMLRVGQSPSAVGLFIADDTDDGALKRTLRASFRTLRAREQPRLRNVHDDMYFGSSTDSVGIQMADMCSFFMMRHLRDREVDEFYQTFKAQAVCAKPHPEWQTYEGVFRQHWI